MRLSRRSCALVIALGLAAAASFAAEPAIAPGARFHDLELQWMNALAAQDAGVLERMLAAEFTIIGVGSTLEDAVGTRAQWLELAVKRPFPKHQVQVLQVLQLPEVAVVHLVLTGDYPPMPWIPEGGTLKFLVTDTWIYRDGRWQVAARHASFPAKGAP